MTGNSMTFPSIVNVALCDMKTSSRQCVNFHQSRISAKIEFGTSTAVAKRECTQPARRVPEHERLWSAGDIARSCVNYVPARKTILAAFHQTTAIEIL
jgi:hypothetical protein